jgi:alpha-glucosidase
VLADERPWWQEAVFYQIYPRSFADSDGDGVGDLAGIRAHLDDLVWLGVDALWLSPFYPSPMADFGYDISDYCDVDPLFGTLEDFDGLIADAHALGLKVIVDWVPNHTSDLHPWFVDAVSGPDSAHRAWYVWRDATPDGAPPNNWVSSFDLTAPAWSLDGRSGQWYLHLFEPGQPDLDWDHDEVVSAMHQVLRFWLDRGVDGFRADVVHCIGKDPALPDDPPEVAGIPHSALNDAPVTHQRLRDIRTLVDGYPGQRVVVGEVYLLSTEAVATYYGDGDELHLAFNFPPLYAPWRAEAWRQCIDATVGALDPRGAWPTWVLSNHDNPRHRTRYDRAGTHRGEDAGTTGPGRGRAPAHSAGHPVPLPGGGARTARRGDPGRTGRRPRWSRRLSGPGALGRIRRPRVAGARRGRAVAPLPPRGRHAQLRVAAPRPGLHPPSLPTAARAAAT